MKPWPLILGMIVLLSVVFSPGLAITKSDVFPQYQRGFPLSPIPTPSAQIPWGHIPNGPIVPDPTIDPTPPLESLKVTSNPAGATVSLDGMERGISPITLTGLSTGLHKLTVTKSGYQDYSTWVRITIGKTATVHATLKVKGGPTTVPTTVPTTIPTTAPTHSPTGSGTSESYICGLQWGSDGGNGQATQLMGIAVDDSGNVYVVEWGNHRIQKYGPDGTFITKWEYNTPLANLDTCPYLESMKNAIVNVTEEELIAACQHWKPRDIAVDSSGNVYVSDNEHFGWYMTRDDRILKFNSDGTFITSWGSYGSGDGQFDSPHGVAVDSSGNVYVADYGNNRIQKFSSDGTFITAWGSEGTGDSQIQKPISIAVDGSGNVYVVELNNDRIKKFSSDGTFITAWGSEGSRKDDPNECCDPPGSFDLILGVAADNSGNVYVAEQGNNGRIQKFSSNGLFLTMWEIDGCPHDVAVDGSGNVYVTDECKDRILKFIRNTNPESIIPPLGPTRVPTTPVPTTTPTQTPPSDETGSFSVTSTPTGAEVYLDGTYKGTTPLTISGISVGTHHLEVSKSGFQDYYTAFLIRKGKTDNIHVTLRERFPWRELLPDRRIGTIYSWDYFELNDSVDIEEDLSVEKPNIYLYSDHDLTAQVRLMPEGAIIVSDPVYQPGMGWQAAIWNGSLNGKGDFLFYEGLVPVSGWQKREGYVIRAAYRGQDMAFMLGQYGFNGKETAEFIDYWVSHLTGGVDYVFYPQETDAVDRVMPLIIIPEPDDVMRIWFYAEPLVSAPEPVTSPEQIVREGFYVVEWGVMVKEK